MLAVAAALLGGPATVDACTCIKPSMATELERAARVVIGRVTRLEPTGEQNSFEEPRVIVTLEVLRSWKGPHDERRVVLHTVRNRLSCEGFWFEDGKTYLVVARAQPDGTLGTSFCYGTEAADKAVENITALDRLTGAAAGGLEDR